MNVATGCGCRCMCHIHTKYKCKNFARPGTGGFCYDCVYHKQCKRK